MSAPERIWTHDTEFGVMAKQRASWGSDEYVRADKFEALRELLREAETFLREHRQVASVCRVCAETWPCETATWLTRLKEALDD